MILESQSMMYTMRVLNSLSDLNIFRILRLIWQEKKISRVDIASRLKMDKSTVTRIITDLTSRNIVKEAESGESGPLGGRKPVFLEIQENYACAGGVEINPERMCCSLLSLQGTVLFQYMKNVEPEEYDEEGCIGFFMQAVKLLEDEAKKQKITLVGIGLGIPGLVDSAKGKIHKSIPLLISEPLNFVEEIKSLVSVPVYIENDARCCCYTERFSLDNQLGEKNILYVMAEFRHQMPIVSSPKTLAVGFGLILDGKIYHGSQATAGEFRSILWSAESPTQFAESAKKIDSLDDKEVTNPIFKELAQNIAFLSNTLNFDIVYIGGLEREYAEEIVKFTREAIVYLWPYEWTKTTFVTTGKISNQVVSYGAASMVLDKLFAIPELDSENKEAVKTILNPPKSNRKQ